jgi:hypothetical protein
MFLDQVTAFANRGLDTRPVSDKVIAGFRPLPPIAPGSTVVYRGWMLKSEEYERLHMAILSAGGVPLTSPKVYLLAHHLPNWYPVIADLTPETRVFSTDAELVKELELLGWGQFFVKDYVKSLKTSRGSILHDPSDIHEMLAEMKRVRDEIEGGVCVRRVEEFVPGSERRHFVLHGKAYPPDGCEKVPDVVSACVKQVHSPFFSVDVVERQDGVERVVEIGDGQVSDLVGWSSDRFANIWPAA